MKNSQNVFTDIYDKNFWTNGSGPGSRLDTTVEYREKIEHFIKTAKIESIADICCGDMQFTQAMDLHGALYTGYDVVQSVITKNLKTYPDKNFVCCDVINETDDIKPAELILVKDAVMHWPNMAILQTLPKLLKKCDWLILTNDSEQLTDNDIKLGEFRPLNIVRYPLNQFKACFLLNYNKKDVWLLRGDGWEKF
jgi:2-polyprenyl-3-methyl-5-hydroxy-6-metoxy-1,4-benzoquinol methylase